MNCKLCGKELRHNNRSGYCTDCYGVGQGPLNVELSDREKEILVLLSNGETYDSASVKLDPSTTEQTVKNRLRIIRRKLDSPTTTSAVAKAIRAGLLV